MNRLWLAAPLLLFLGLAIFLFAGLENDPRKLPSVLIGKPAPDFSLESLTEPDATVSKQSLLGQAYILNVWGSWCFACRIEHETVSRLATQVPVYGLNWKDERSEALRWLQQFGNPYIASAYDPGGRTGIDFGVYGAPETFIVDAQGCIRYKHVGPLDETIVSEDILPRLTALRDPSAGNDGACG